MEKLRLRLGKRTHRPCHFQVAFAEDTDGDAEEHNAEEADHGANGLMGSASFSGQGWSAMFLRGYVAIWFQNWYPTTPILTDPCWSDPLEMYGSFGFLLSQIRPNKIRDPTR